MRRRAAYIYEYFIAFRDGDSYFDMAASQRKASPVAAAEEDNRGCRLVYEEIPPSL